MRYYTRVPWPIAFLGKGLLFLAGLAVLGYQECSKQLGRSGQEAPRPYATTLAVSEVQLVESRLWTLADGSGHELVARIRNKSTRGITLQRVGLRLVLKDCSGARNCDIIGDEIARVAITVPPGQVRACTARVKFRDTPETRGELIWDEEFVELEGTALR